jgi:hypothetical protein
MGRGCRTRLRLRHSSPFPAHSLIALGPHSAKRSHAIPDGLEFVSGTEKCLYVVGYDVVIPGSFGHTRLDRVSGSPIVVGDVGGIVVADDSAIVVGG